MRHLRLLMTFMSALMLNAAFAFTLEGIRYSVNDGEENTVTLTGWDKSYFSSIDDPVNPSVGDVDEDALGPTDFVIPWRVNDDGVWYRVTAIGEKAFSDCVSLTSVTIPNSVEAIGEYAFQNCTSLNSVKVQWITPITINENVFSGVDYETCRLNVLSGYKSAYQEADVWKNFLTIGEYADVDVNMMFVDAKVKELCVANWDTNNDGELTYREAMAVTGLNNVFSGNTEITAFPELRSFNSLKIINESEFEGCTNLGSIILPPNLTKIGNNAFKDCTNAIFQFTSVNLTTIGDHAFDGCASLESFTVTAKISSIGEAAFANCTSLTGFSASSSNKYFAIYSSTNRRFLLTKDKTVMVSFAGGYKGACVVPTTVTEILPYAAAGASLTSITFNNVQAIGRGAFKGCASLTSLSFPEPLKFINDQAFADCQKLYTIIIPTTVSSIGDQAFAGVAKGIRVQVADETPKEITDGTFSNFTEIAEGEITGRLFVPEGTVDAYAEADGWKWFNFVREGTIADYAGEIINFQDEATEALCVANFDTDNDGYVIYSEAEAVTSFGSVFKNSAIGSFNEMKYFTAVTAIDDDAFNGSTISELTFPEGLISIGSHAFANCNALTTVTIPAKVKEIGDGAFAACAALKAINVDENNLNFTGSTSGTLFSSDHTNLIQFPANAKVTSILVSEGIMTIAPEAFSGASKITSVTFFHSVSEIGEKAFADCSSLANVKVYWTEPLEVPANIFEGVDVANAQLNVPQGTAELYEAADVWKDFGNKVEFSDDYTGIVFADSKVEAICISAWDTNGDGSLSKIEAKAVTSLGDRFQGNTEITSFKELSYFTGLTEIPANAFKGCTALTSVTFPTTIKVIGESAFEGCSVLATAILPTALTTLGKKAFYGTALLRISIKSNLASIGEGAFGSIPTILANRITIAETNPYFVVYSTSIFTKDTTTLITYPTYKAISPTMPEKVKNIYGYAFSGCENITGMNFVNVETIGEYAFENCTGITSLTLGDKVTTVDQYAFTGCSNLESIVIPDNVTSIAAGAFSGMPVGVKCQVTRTTPLEIPAGTFTNAVEPEEGKARGLLFVPEGTAELYRSATGWDFFSIIHEGSVEDYDATLLVFADKNVEKLAVAAWDTDGDNKLSFAEAAAVSALGEVFTDQPITTFHELQYFTSLTEIGDNAFRNTGMTGLTMPEGITRFGNSSFQGTAISTFNALPGLTEIGDSAFAYNKSFTKLTISERITKIGMGAYKGCAKLTAINVVSDNANYSSKDGVLYDKAGTRLMQYPVAKKQVSDFVISDAVTTIDEDAFLMAANLTSVTIPENVTAIGENAFRACESLDSVTVGWRTPLAVPANTFEGVDVANATLCVPKGTVAIYKATDVWKEFGLMTEFLDDTSIIEFADAKVKSLCVSTWDTNGDGELTVAEAKAATSLGGLFTGNTDITSFDELKYFTGITSLKDNEFQGCSNLASIELPNSLTTIGQGAFSACTSLTTIEIPSKVSSIKIGVFANNTSLESITVDVANTKYVAVDGVLYNKAKTVLVAYPAGREGYYTMPNTVKTVSSYSFTGANKLTGVKTSKVLNSIGEGAFRNSSLPYIYLPASVTSISRWAFMDCDNLEVVKVGWEEPFSILQTVFMDMDYTARRLYVPAGTKGDYEEKDVWKDFGTIKEYPNCDVNDDGYADMLDAVDIVKYVIGTPAAEFDKYVADFDDDDDITVADAVKLVGMIADGTAAPNINAAPAYRGGEEVLTLTKDVNNIFSLSLTSMQPYTAFQFDLTLPEGTEVDMAQATARLKGHQLVYNQIGERTWRFAAISLSNRQFTDYEGSLLNIKAGNPDLDEVMASNIRFVTPDGTIHSFDTVSSATPTGIAETMTENTLEDGVYYNLSGVRVSSPDKGVYILNGKKVIIK